MTGKHFDNVYYNFFTKALSRNKGLEVKHVATDNVFDASILKNKCDVIILFHNNNKFGMPEKITGIKQLDVPVIARSTDPVDVKKSLKLHDEWKIDYYFHFWSPSFFYQLYPRHYKYKTIIFGLEPSLYHNVKPFSQRIKNRILNSGNIGNTKFLSRIINTIRKPKWNNLRIYYLRTICNKLPYVDYTPTYKQKFVGDGYPLLLQQYCAAIAANTLCTVAKMWEIPAAGCLNFLEVTKKNHVEEIGFVDDETAIFINEKNYKEKFEEFLSDPNNLKWEKIARQGRTFALEKLNNDKAVESLVELIKKIKE